MGYNSDFIAVEIQPPQASQLTHAGRQCFNAVVTNILHKENHQVNLTYPSSMSCFYNPLIYTANQLKPSMMISIPLHPQYLRHSHNLYVLICVTTTLTSGLEDYSQALQMKLK